MGPDQQPTAATKAPVDLVRDVLREAGNQRDVEAQRLRDERVRIDDQLEELNRRRDAIDTAYQLPDDVLMRLINEVGAALPGARRAATDEYDEHLTEALRHA